MIFLPGDIVKCTKHIKFCDGTSHKKDELIEVTKKNEAYFNHEINNKYYKLYGR